MEQNKLGRFSAILDKRDDFCVFLFALQYTNGTTLKAKYLLPRGANSFILELTHFLKGEQTIFNRVVSLEVYPLALSIGSGKSFSDSFWLFFVPDFNL